MKKTKPLTPQAMEAEVRKFFDDMGVELEFVDVEREAKRESARTKKTKIKK